MPRYSDLAIFVATTDRQTDKPIALPLAHARGVMTAKVVSLLAIYTAAWV